MSMPYDDAQNPAHRWITQFQHVTQTVGLYTHDDGSYSFIMIEEDRVSAAGVTFTETGKILLENYKAKWASASAKPQTVGNVNQQLIEETYIMSQALYHSSWIEIATFAEPVEGSSYMYGWHFNWNGSKAAVVTSVKHLHGDAIIYHERQEHFLHEVTIHEDAGGILTASLELLETADAYILEGELSVWNPANVGGQMQVNPIIFCNEQTDYDLVDFEVPLYVCYKPDGSLKVIRFFREVQNLGVTFDDAVDAVDDINCPDRGWQTRGPGVIAATGEAATESCISGFKVDGVVMSQRRSEFGGFYRDRYYSRTLNGDSCCDSRTGWNAANISVWTDSDFIIDSSNNNCAISGCMFETNEVDIVYTEYMSTTGGPSLGIAIPKFALLICGRSTDSVALLTYETLSQHMLYEHREELGHDDVVQRARVNFYYCGEEVSTKESFVMPVGSCGIQGNVTTTLGGWQCTPEDYISESHQETVQTYETNVWIVNPYETEQTYHDVTEDYYKNGEYIPYLSPVICNNIPLTNLWYDISSFSGRSLRKELEDNDVENNGSNCEISVDLPGGTGFWLGAT